MKNEICWTLIPGIEDDPREPNLHQKQLMLECVHTSSSVEILTELKSILFGSADDIIKQIYLIEINMLKEYVTKCITTTVGDKLATTFIDWFENVYCVFRNRQVDELAKHYLFIFKDKIFMVAAFGGENVLSCTVYAGKENEYTDIIVEHLDHLIEVLHKNIL